LILLDTSGLLAAIDSSQRLHHAAAKVLLAAEAPLLLSPFVLAELDYLLATRVGLEAEVALLEEVADGAYQLEHFDRNDVAAATDLVRRYGSVELGLADASIVVLGHRHGVSTVLTLDEHHFRTVRGPGGEPFRILPADS
jgi:predicted nucleic acid-binding protein